MGISAYVAGGLLGGLLLGQMTSKPGKSPQMQAAAPPPLPAAQTAKTPDASAVAQGLAGTGQAGGTPGVAQTFLTGPGGIDPSLLQLGKTTLLGG
jgi:hypothetical protein